MKWTLDTDIPYIHPKLVAYALGLSMLVRLLLA